MVNQDNGNERPLDDSEHGQIEALKSEIKSLHGDIDKMLDSIKQTTLTQNQLARAALTAKEIADSAMAELTKTKSEMATALTEIQKKASEGLSVAIQQTMKGFVDEISKKTDEKIVAVLGNTTATVDGVKVPAQVNNRQSGGIADIINAIGPYFEPLTKLIQAFRPPVPTVAPLADQLTNFLRLQKVLGDLTNANVDIEKFHKDATEALKTVSHQPPA